MNPFVRIPLERDKKTHPAIHATTLQRYTEAIYGITPHPSKRKSTYPLQSTSKTPIRATPHHPYHNHTSKPSQSQKKKTRASRVFAYYIFYF